MTERAPLPDLSAPVYTHVCLDCGALGVAGGYHDHGDGNAGETLRLTELPALIAAFQNHEQAQYEAEEQRDQLVEALRWTRRSLALMGCTCSTGGYGECTCGPDSPMGRDRAKVAEIDELLGSLTLDEERQS